MYFLDPTNDLAFRRIFGNKKKKEILISFLNNILNLNNAELIKDVVLLNTNQVPRLIGTKETILDVRCIDQTGAEYIVEMQVLPRAHFDQRVLYYSSQAYTHQLERGSEYKKLRPVIFIGVLNFEFTQNQHYLSLHRIHDIETKEHLLRDFCFIFIELPKFNKSEQELVTVQEKWIYFLKHAKNLETVPDVIQEAAIKEAFSIVEEMRWTKSEMLIYHRRWIQVQDEMNSVLYGERKQSYKIAQKLRQKELPIELIAETTGVTIEEVKKISEAV